ncbi:hypothetical protein OROMI_005064 [Orobanche minor]
MWNYPVIILSKIWFVRPPVGEGLSVDCGIEGVGMAAYKKSMATANNLKDTNSGAPSLLFPVVLLFSE